MTLPRRNEHKAGPSADQLGVGARPAAPPSRLAVLVIGMLVVANLAGLGLLGAIEFVPGFEAATIARLQGLADALPLGVTGESLLASGIRKGLLVCVAILPVMLLEAWLAGWRESALSRLLVGRSMSSRTDALMFGMQFLGLWKFVTWIFTFGGAVVAGILVAQITVGIATHGLKLRTGYVVLDTGLAVILFTFVDYWAHRLFHTRALWPLHRMHHSAEEMTTLTVWRNHPAAPAIDAFFKVWPLALFDVPPVAVACIGLAVMAYQHLIHSNVGWNWGWFGRWVLIPPAGHRLHHAMDRTLHGVNLGIPVVWDRLFGTFTDPRQVTQQTPIGVGDAPVNTGRLHREAWYDLKDWMRVLWQPLAAAQRRSRAASGTGTASDKAPPPAPG